MEKKSMKGYLYLMPALIVILLFTIYPLIRAFIMSFMEIGRASCRERV